MAVTTLLAMPSAQGLFTRVIAQSGVGDRVMAARGRRQGHAGSRAAPRGAAEPRGLRRGSHPEALRRAVRAHPGHPQGADALGPDRDHDDAVRARPRRGLAAAGSAGRRALRGRRRRRADPGQQHGRAPLLPRPARAPRPARRQLRQRRAPDLRRAPASTCGRPTTSATRRRASCSPRPRATSSSGCPTSSFAEARRHGSAGTWMYEFAWRSPLYAGQLGACHYLEVPFVFDTIDTPSAALVTGADAAAADRRRDAPALAGVRRRPATRAGLATRPSGGRS